MLCNPHFMHPLFSFSLYSPRQMRTHFLQTNEYKAYRSSKETYKKAKNTHKNRNVAMIRVTRNTWLKNVVLAHGSEGHETRCEMVLLCLIWWGFIKFRTFFVCVCVYYFMAKYGVELCRCYEVKCWCVRVVILCRGWMCVNGMSETLCCGFHLGVIKRGSCMGLYVTMEGVKTLHLRACIEVMLCRGELLGIPLLTRCVAIHGA